MHSSLKRKSNGKDDAQTKTSKQRLSKKQKTSPFLEEIIDVNSDSDAENDPLPPLVSTSNGQAGNNATSSKRRVKRAIPFSPPSADLPTSSSAAIAIPTPLSSTPEAAIAPDEMVPSPVSHPFLPFQYPI